MKLKRFAELNESKKGEDDRDPITFEYIKGCVMEQLKDKGHPDEFLAINIVQDMIDTMVEDKLYDIKQELNDLDSSGLFGKLDEELCEYGDELGYDD